jgi:hypothetical protein
MLEIWDSSDIPEVLGHEGDGLDEKTTLGIGIGLQ